MHERDPVATPDRRLRGESLHRLPDREGRRVGRERLAEGAVEMSGKLLRPLPEEAAAAEAEEASPDVVEMDRDDRGRCLLDDLLEAALERPQKADPRDRPLREDADEMPFGQRLARFPQRLHEGPGPAAGVDRNDVAPAEDPVEERYLEERAPRSRSGLAAETGPTPSGSANRASFDVIADEERGAVARHVVLAVNMEPPEGAWVKIQEGEAEPPGHNGGSQTVTPQQEDDAEDCPRPPREVDQTRQIRAPWRDAGCGCGRLRKSYELRDIGGGDPVSSLAFRAEVRCRSRET